MDAGFIRHFINATQNVFGTMLQSTVSFEAPAPTAQFAAGSDVSGIIGFSGDIVGAAVLRLPMGTASGIVAAFTGDAFEPGSEDFADAIGELANMICGNAKSSLANAAVSISCPQVVLGRDHRVQRPSDAVSVTLPCNSSQGRFFIEISVRASRAALLPATAAAG